MITINVCVGSACHLKGAYGIIDSFQHLIEEHQLKDKIILKGAFCLGHCTHGVSVKIDDDDDVLSVNEESIKDFFENIVLRRINN